MIVKMKRAKIFVLKEQELKLKRSLQRFGVMMITNENIHALDTQYEDSLIARTNRVIKELSKYIEKPKLFSPKFQVVDYDRFSDVREEQVTLLENIEKLLSKISKIEAKSLELEEINQSLLPWRNLEASTKDINNLEYINVYLGQVLTNDLESFDEFLKLNQIIYQTYDSDANGLAYVVISEADIKTDLEAGGFTLVNLLETENLFETEISNNELQIEQNHHEIKALEDSLKQLALHLDEIRLLSDQMLSEKELKRYQASETDKTIYFEGWVREDELDKLEKSVSNVTDHYEIDLRDPLPQEIPPTQHKNNKFVEPFETITNMFAVPKYDEIDPNPVMSVWYWLFFGMMMGDWGYGLVLMVLLGLFKLIKKPKGDFKKLINVLFLSTFTTIVFGVLYGSVFGISYDIGNLFGVNFQVFDSMNDPITMLIASLVVGVLHIFTGLILKAITLGKEKDWMGILAETVSWMLLIPGLAVLLVLPDFKIYGIIAAAIGALFILLFAGRDKKGVIGKVMGGLGGLYNITGILSDILSYSRILALALSSGVIAFAMNTIGAMLMGPWYGYIFGIIVFIIGHVFNLAMGLLSAYVHDGRLQYIEFFGKFYEGGGYSFAPLALKYNYIYEVTDNDL